MVAVGTAVVVVRLFVAVGALLRWAVQAVLVVTVVACVHFSGPTLASCGGLFILGVLALPRQEMVYEEARVAAVAALAEQQLR